jgi:general secretion pathway protein G
MVSGLFMRNRQPQRSGFTLIELLVVLAVIAVLVSLVAPRYINQVDHAKEAVLRQQLTGVRDAIDRYYGIHQHYPANLDELVSERFLRGVPTDPLTDKNNSWVLVQNARSDGGIFDIHSGAQGLGSDGKPYASW